MGDLLVVENLKTYYYVQGGVVRAVDGVSFKISEGESLGLAGESGCGKSTLGFSILRMVPPPGRIVDGKIIFMGQDITALPEEVFREEIRWTKISMIFQGALNILNPVYKIGSQLAEPLIYRRSMSKKDAMEEVVRVLKSVGLTPDILDRYPHELSGGMKQRVIIGMAIIMNPTLVIADEPTTALDVITQAQIVNLLKMLQRERGISIILITHDLGVMSELVDKIGIMYAGKIVEFGSLDQVYRNPLHPYTQKLIMATPTLRSSIKKIDFIPGSPPDLINPPAGCRFHPRCQFFMPICREKEPPEIELERGHSVACWLYA